MMKIALVIAYFGELPKYADFFWKSLEYNSSIDVILFTDQKIYYNKSNLKVINCSFEYIVERIQEKFDFEIVCNRPYKLCDYKPAYGYIFSEELKKYDFWGHCDLDMILGDVRKFLSDEILSEHDKIYQHGHMCLYKNTFENNTRFMSTVGMSYKEVFRTPIICVFDEIIGMQRKYDLLGISSYKKTEYADISPWRDSFKRVESHLNKNEKDGFNYRLQVFYWEKGKIYRAYVEEERVRTDEFIYLHFQKRKLCPENTKIINADKFFITREGFITKPVLGAPTKDEIIMYNGSRAIFELKKRIDLFVFTWKRRFNKYIMKR